MEMIIQAIAVYSKKNGDSQDSIYRRACEQCVNAGGLKSIFPVFMGKALPRAVVCIDVHHKRKNKRDQQEWVQQLEAD
jgi:hypothetical protein